MVIDPGPGFQPDTQIEIPCEHCGHEAWIPFYDDRGNHVIASFGMGVVLDKPKRKDQPPSLPLRIKCRKCRHEFIFDNE